MSDSGMRNFNNDILDYYAILGVPRYASTNDIGNAYKNLVYIHHPDKNIGDEDALMRYKAIDEAYRTLMNSDSRKSYDDQLLRNENSAKQLRNSDSTFGKVFGVVISRFDNSKDYLSVESKDIAKSICLNAAFCDSDATLDARVTDLVWGLPYDGRVERSSSDFYRLLLRDNDLKNGFLVSCKSLTKDKFKIIIYNSQDGEISQQLSSSRSRDGRHTYASLYSTPFPTYKCVEPSRRSWTDVNGIESVFHELDHFVPSRLELNAGYYLLSVVGENFIGKSSYRLCVTPVDNSGPLVEDIAIFDRTILETRKSLMELKDEFHEAKRVYEEKLLRMNQMHERIETLLDAHEQAYSDFENATFLKYAHTAASQQETQFAKISLSDESGIAIKDSRLSSVILAGEWLTNAFGTLLNPSTSNLDEDEVMSTVATEGGSNRDYEQAPASLDSLVALNMDAENAAVDESKDMSARKSDASSVDGDVGRDHPLINTEEETL